MLASPATFRVVAGDAAWLSKPDKAAQTELLDVLANTLVDARKALSDQGGRITMRRLNQREYRNTIFNHAWGEDDFPNSQTLDQHISQLRKRIETDPRHPRIIQTLHGVGYRFDAT